MNNGLGIFLLLNIEGIASEQRGHLVVLLQAQAVGGALLAQV